MLFYVNQDDAAGFVNAYYRDQEYLESVSQELSRVKMDEDRSILNAQLQGKLVIEGPFEMRRLNERYFKQRYMFCFQKLLIICDRLGGDILQAVYLSPVGVYRYASRDHTNPNLLNVIAFGVENLAEDSQSSFQIKSHQAKVLQPDAANEMASVKDMDELTRAFQEWIRPRHSPCHSVQAEWAIVYPRYSIEQLIARPFTCNETNCQSLLYGVICIGLYCPKCKKIYHEGCYQGKSKPMRSSIIGNSSTHERAKNGAKGKETSKLREEVDAALGNNTDIEKLEAVETPIGAYLLYAGDKEGELKLRVKTLDKNGKDIRLIKFKMEANYAKSQIGLRLKSGKQPIKMYSTFANLIKANKEIYGTKFNLIDWLKDNHPNEPEEYVYQGDDDNHEDDGDNEMVSSSDNLKEETEDEKNNGGRENDDVGAYAYGTVDPISEEDDSFDGKRNVSETEEDEEQFEIVANNSANNEGIPIWPLDIQNPDQYLNEKPEGTFLVAALKKDPLEPYIIYLRKKRRETNEIKTSQLSVKADIDPQTGAIVALKDAKRKYATIEEFIHKHRKYFVNALYPPPVEEDDEEDQFEAGMAALTRPGSLKLNTNVRPRQSLSVSPSPSSSQLTTPSTANVSPATSPRRRKTYGEAEWQQVQLNTPSRSPASPARRKESGELEWRQGQLTTPPTAPSSVSPTSPGRRRASQIEDWQEAMRVNSARQWNMEPKKRMTQGELKKLPYFMGEMDHHVAKRLLHKVEPGTFLLRQNSDGEFRYSYKKSTEDGHVLHLKVTEQVDGFYVGGQTRAKSIVDLTKIFNERKAEGGGSKYRFHIPYERK